MTAGVTASDGPGGERPLIICGMHRSGTSFVASLVAGAGVHLGDKLLESSPGNPRGHFEDVGILEFHRTALVANGIVSEGYTTQSPIALSPSLHRLATELVATRAGRDRTWGWKEPRTTLFLDVWRRLLPGGRFLLMFRRPWEVVDSLYRRGETAFRHNPAFALDIWLHYNRLALEFAARHPEATLVCEAAQAVADPRGLCNSIRQRLGVPLGDPPDCYDASLLRQDADAGRPALLAAMCPEAITLYRQLQELAGSSAAASPESVECDTAPTALRAHLLAEWQRSAVHEHTEAAARGQRGRDTRGSERLQWPRLAWWRRPPSRRAA
jgi:hypothetical protein